MYINVEYLRQKDLNLSDVLTLQVIKQLKIEPEREEDLAMVLTDDFMEKAFERGYITTIKGKKKDSELSRLRLTSTGNKLLENIETPKVTEGDLKMYEHLCNFYLSHEDEERVLGNQKKTKMYCAIFRNRLSLSLHEMYWLCWLFVQRYEYTKKLENIFFDSNKIRYGKFENHFEDAPLYQFYEENKQEIKRLWEQKIK